MRSRPVALAIVTTVAAGCGAPLEERAPPAPTVSEVAVRTGAPVAAETPLTALEMFTATSTVERLGAAGDRIVVVAGSRTFEVASGHLEARALFAAPGDPASTGDVFGIAARGAGGVWLAARNGLFLLDRWYVTKSPLTFGAGAVRAVAEATAGPMQGLWVASDDGLFRRQNDRLERYGLPSPDGPATDVAVERDGTAALVIVGGELVLLDAEEGRILADRPPLDAGAVTAVGAGKGVLYAATEKGLVRWRRGDTPRWTRLSLAPDGAPAVAVTALALDRATDAAWIRGDGKIALARLDGDRLTSHSLPMATSPGATTKVRMAVDAFGDVWLAAGTRLWRLTAAASAGTAASFATDVAPWIAERCKRCHADFTQYDVFAPKAAEALGKVRAGEMPRCTGGVFCPPEQRLKPEEYEVLQRWVRGGKLP